MKTRELLGPADVTDDELAAMVADLLGEEHIEVLDVRVDPVDYQLPAITTATRHWVSGLASTSRGTAPFRIFVKHVQSWSRSPLFAYLPEHLRVDPYVANIVPWRAEPQVYRSDLAERLPMGLSMPRALGVFDLDDLSAAVWLAEVPHYDRTWDLDRYRRAAYLLGRLSGSAQVAPLSHVGGHPWSVRDYLRGRFEHQVVSMLEDDELWTHPLFTAGYDADLRARMRAGAVRVPGYVEELAAARHLPAHGDACPNNLLGAPDPDDIVLIDFGFWMALPVGFDLGQLLLGEVQLGRRPAASLAETEAAIVPAYLEGLAAEGVTVKLDEVRRLHALHMLIFVGLSAMPFDLFGAELTDDVHRVAADRAVISRYCLDLVDSTDPVK